MNTTPLCFLFTLLIVPFRTMCSVLYFHSFFQKEKKKGKKHLPR